MENKLPNGWVECEVGDILTLKNGYAFKRNDYSENGIPLIRISDLINGKVNNTNSVKIPVELLMKDFQVEKGDILIAMSGATTGKIGIYENASISLQNQRVGNFKLHSDKYFNKRFLFHLVFDLKKTIEEAAYGGAQPNISAGKIESLRIKIPPLQEQNRIVAKLDAIMQKIELNKERLEQIPKILKHFRQSVLAAAVSGRLTEEWRKNHKELEQDKVSIINKEREILQKENAIKRGQKTFRYKEPVKIEIGEKTKGIDNLFDIPVTWNWVSLDQCVWNINDGPHFSPSYVEKENGIAFISGRNITYNKIDFKDAKYVSKEDHIEFTKRGKPEKDDILLTKGGTTGIAHKIETDIDFSIWVHVALLKVIKKYVSPDYLRDTLTSDFVYLQSQAQTHGVGNQDLGLTRMIYMAIPLPPLQEQIEISKRVEQLFAFADKLEARYTKAKAMLDKLPQSILAKAFRGELVEQNPNDEPASVLLGRIKREKVKKVDKKR